MPCWYMCVKLFSPAAAWGSECARRGNDCLELKELGHWGTYRLNYHKEIIILIYWPHWSILVRPGIEQQRWFTKGFLNENGNPRFCRRIKEVGWYVTVGSCHPPSVFCVGDHQWIPFFPFNQWACKGTTRSGSQKGMPASKTCWNLRHPVCHPHAWLVMFMNVCRGIAC